jgi:hypothetical protein
VDAANAQYWATAWLVTMNIASIFLRHGTKKYPDSEELMLDLFRRRMPGVEQDIAIVDTALPEGYRERTAANTTTLGCNGEFSEFSAADVALQWFGPRLWSYDLVHIATAAFHTLYTSYLERFDTLMLESILGRPVCVGHIDCYNEPVSLFSYRSQHWLRTSFLFLPPGELLSLGSLASFRDKDRVFSGDPQKPFRADAPLSENYRDYIVDWLVGRDIGQGVTWHSGFQLSLETLGEFERKTTAILNEHLFAIRLRALGCKIVDTTWLATEIAAAGPRKIRWSLGWREQLATRGADALVITT